MIRQLTCCFFILCAANSFALDVNSVGPEFKLQGADGKDHSLSDYLGKVLVLEWLNHDCPFVKKHYLSGNMQITQSIAIEKGANWVSIISSAPGKQGHSDAKRALLDKNKNKAKAQNILFDETGSVGKAYGAKTTPYIVILSQKGKVAYTGAIDSISSASQEDIPNAKNYVLEALNEIFSGKKVSRAKTDSYGCSVKY